MIHRSAFVMTIARLAAIIVLSSFAWLWSTPLWWMLVAALRDLGSGELSDATLLPGSPSLAHFSDAWQQGDFFRLVSEYRIVVLGILVVQLITITLAGYAFARLHFPGRDLVFYLFLARIALAAPILIVPNTVTIVRMGLYDSLLGVMAPYFASAFGIFLMRQTFKTIPAISKRQQ